MALGNTYYLVRHGNSLANQAGVIVSYMEGGTSEQWGLSPLGQSQARQAGQSLRQELASFQQPPLVLASPFSRTMQTAELIVSELSPSITVQAEPGLREREFGSLDGTPDTNYASVWAQDAETSGHQAGGHGETVADVAARTSAVVNALEAGHSGRSVLLVAHGDSLSILAAALLGPSLRQHRLHALPNCGVLCIPMP